ncbi:MAG: isopentenyl-diphosphate Delta-isomerase [Amoebophilaceae bacterium]|nr:isopentenyl-diphosphate Delta-isomerase [Amoebophilaceae bacterium]
MLPEMLVLVDQADQVIGVEEKMKVHREGLLHRAFSIMIFNNQGQLLIQKRSAIKYHSAGLWANSCCGHPRLHEDNLAAAQRRLREELGFTCPLVKITTVSYALKLANGLYEHEYTHLFTGVYTAGLDLNPDEVAEIKWIMPVDLQQEATLNPEPYAAWFRLYLTTCYAKIFA